MYRLSLIMQFSLKFFLIVVTAQNAQSGLSFLLDQPMIVNKLKCPLFLCQLKCKRYIMNNGCPTCKCNPCVFSDPLATASCGQSTRHRSTARGVYKVNTLTDKSYCCPKAHEDCYSYSISIKLSYLGESSFVFLTSIITFFSKRFKMFSSVFDQLQFFFTNAF